MQKMIYKKTPESQGEVVIMVNSYKGLDGKLKAIIMHNPNHAIAWRDMPYEEVKLNRLRPTDEFFESVFEQEMKK